MFAVMTDVLEHLMKNEGACYLTPTAAYVAMDGIMYIFPGDFSEMNETEFNAYIQATFK